MFNKIKPLLLLCLFFSLAISCRMFSDHHVELVEINEKGIAIFEVSNYTSDDILSIEFELTYSNSYREVIKVDTVHYSSSSGAFIKAEGQTIIAQKVPNNTSTATAKIISTTN